MPPNHLSGEEETLESPIEDPIVDLILDPDVARSEATYTFFVCNVGQLTDDVVSPPFMLRGMQWVILVKPNSTGLSFFVKCNGRNGSPNWSCNATAELRLLAHQPSAQTYTKGPITHLFNAAEDDFGYAVFISWQKLLHMVDSYVISRGVMLEAHVIADAPQGLEN